MPLDPSKLALDIKPIWKQWSFTAFNGMHTIPFSEDLPLQEMQQLTADGFGNLFSGISTQLVTAINDALILGIVSTPNGTAPPLPMQIPSVSIGMKTVFKKWCSKSFMDMHLATFSEDLSQSEMQELTADKYGETFSNISMDFADELIKGLSASGFISLVKTNIASSFKPIFKKWAKKSFKEMHGSSFSEDIPLQQMQILTAQKYSEVFSNIAQEFSAEIIKTFKSSPVSVSIGVGNIS